MTPIIIIGLGLFFLIAGVIGGNTIMIIAAAGVLVGDLIWSFKIIKSENILKSNTVTYPAIVTWYLNVFPRRIYCFIGAGVIGVGLILTILGKNAAIPTYLACGMVGAASIVHAVVWVIKKRIEKNLDI